MRSSCSSRRIRASRSSRCAPIASSGEISRVMLAIKSALATQDAIPLLVFDEIDANVGGEIANAVGAKMRTLAEKHQVLCITHLPQVAARGAHAFRGDKRSDPRPHFLGTARGERQGASGGNRAHARREERIRAQTCGFFVEGINVQRVNEEQPRGPSSFFGR